MDRHDIEERYIPSGTEAAQRYEVGVSLGVMLASLISAGVVSGGLTLPLSLLVFITDSWAIEGYSYVRWWVEFDAPSAGFTSHPSGHQKANLRCQGPGRSLLA